MDGFAARAVREEGERRLARGLFLGAAGAGVIVLGELYGYIRGVGAVAMFCFIVLVGTRFVAHMANAPADPEITDVSSYGLKYVCEVCGLELRVEKAAKDAPPRHCTEAMTLVSEGGKPPLRPV